MSRKETIMRINYKLKENYEKSKEKSGGDRRPH